MNRFLIDTASNLGNRKFTWLWVLLTWLTFNTCLILFQPNHGEPYSSLFSKTAFLFNWALALMVSFAFLLKYKRSDNQSFSTTFKIVAVVLAWTLRILLSRMGGNYDLESFEIVGDHILNGDNFYQETSRYNYGPIWAYLCAGMKYLSSIGGGYNPLVFHSYMASLLFAFELLLLNTLRKFGYNQLSLLIGLFNPVSIILIGHHSQFDVMALALGFISLLHLQKGQTLLACLFLGLSLTTKHILAFLPLIFLFRKEISVKAKVMYLILPSLIFAFSFLPFLDAWANIKSNVIGYQLNHGQTLIYKLGEILFPHFITDFEVLKYIPFGNAYKPLWLAIIIGFGYWSRNRNFLESALIYLLTILAFSPAISEQYFIIAMPVVLYCLRHWSAWLYILMSSYYLQFVSQHNTSKYFNFSHLGLNLDNHWTAIGFAQIQIIMLFTLFDLIKKSKAPVQ